MFMDYPIGCEQVSATASVSRLFTILFALVSKIFTLRSGNSWWILPSKYATMRNQVIWRKVFSSEGRRVMLGAPLTVPPGGCHVVKTTLTLAAVSLTLLLSTSVFAQKVEYLGAHTVVAGADPFDFVTGGKGVLDFNRRCAAAFEGAQMCESIDVLRSGSLPDDAAVTAGVMQWLKPTIVQVVQNPNVATEILIYDASGLNRSLLGGFSCDGWSTSATNQTGLTMEGNGKFHVTACDQEAFHAVACCKVTTGAKGDKK